MRATRADLGCKAQWPGESPYAVGYAWIEHCTVSMITFALRATHGEYSLGFLSIARATKTKLSTRERALGSDHPLTKSTREALDTLRSSK
jgi:hypothetical protein